MVAPEIALKVVQYFNMALMIGMTTFPKEMLAGYNMDFSCPAKPKKGEECDETENTALVWQCFSIFGIQIGLWCMIAAAMSRPAVSKQAKSVCCLMMAATYGFFMINDGFYILSDAWPESMPKDGAYVNFVLWSIIITLCLSGWKDSGSYTPSLGAMGPIGRFGMPIGAGCLNLAVFALPLIFMREQFIEQYGAGEATAGLPGPIKSMVMLILGNTGKVMVTNIISMLACMSVEPKNEDTQYRLLRACVFNGLFFLGSFSKDAVVSLFLWKDPMRVVTFVQCFAVTFWQANTLTQADITIKPEIKVSMKKQ